MKILTMKNLIMLYVFYILLKAAGSGGESTAKMNDTKDRYSITSNNNIFILKFFQ